MEIKKQIIRSRVCDFKDTWLTFMVDDNDTYTFEHEK